MKFSYNKYNEEVRSANEFEVWLRRPKGGGGGGAGGSSPLYLDDPPTHDRDHKLLPVQSPGGHPKTRAYCTGNITARNMRYILHIDDDLLRPSRRNVPNHKE